MSEPIDALKATTAFGGLTAPLLLQQGGSGVGALDDGDPCCDSYQDGVDGFYDGYNSL